MDLTRQYLYKLHYVFQDVLIDVAVTFASYSIYENSFS